jgi:hypothetical protein
MPLLDCLTSGEAAVKLVNKIPNHRAIKISLLGSMINIPQRN